MTSPGQTRQERVRLKDAGPDDLPQLLALKPDAAIHRDRLEAAAQGGLKYLIILHDEEIVGYALLVFDVPPTWPSIKLLPAVIDLWIRPDSRCRGVGTRAIRIMEQIAKERGCQDVVPAKQVGMKTILIRTGLHRNQQPRIPFEVPDAELEGVPGLAAAVRKVAEQERGVYDTEA